MQSAVAVAVKFADAVAVKFAELVQNRTWTYFGFAGKFGRRTPTAAFFVKGGAHCGVRTPFTPPRQPLLPTRAQRAAPRRNQHATPVLPLTRSPYLVVSAPLMSMKVLVVWLQ